MSVVIIDRRVLGKVPYKGDTRYAYKKRRKLATIIGLGCHHTARLHSPLHGSRAQRTAQAISRASSVAYHVEIFRDTIVLPWAWDLVTWHGNGLNHPTIGVAVAGRFPRHQADYNAAEHDNPFDFEEAIAEFLQYIDKLRATKEDPLPSLKWIMTHSQVAVKPADPGEAITRLFVSHGSRLAKPLIGRHDYVAQRGALWDPEWSKIYAPDSIEILPDPPSS